jgi:hypothetical protein
LETFTPMRNKMSFSPSAILELNRRESEYDFKENDQDDLSLGRKMIYPCIYAPPWKSEIVFL